MTCFLISRRGKLSIQFLLGASSLNELIGYVELTEFREILPESYLNNEEQKCVGIFFNQILPSWRPRNATGLQILFYWNLTDLLKENRNTGKFHTHFEGLMFCD